jgi:beta-barrel assembly-enhancing protease
MRYEEISMRFPFAFTVTAAVALAIAPGCSSNQRIAAEKAVASVLISDEEESKLGLQVKQELDRQGIRYSSDAVVNGFVESVAQKILPHAQRDRPGVKWHVYVIDDAKTVNAFATPGGHLYVYTGLLLASDSEAEVAGVLAHEAGHVVGRHSARQLVNAYGLQAVAAMALGKNPNLLAQLATNVAAQGVLLAHGRSEELEADQLGAQYASSAGYDPRGLIRFFEKLRAKEGKTPAVLAWLSTHPATADRIGQLQKYIAEKRLSGTDPGAARLAPVKQRLAQR